MAYIKTYYEKELQTVLDENALTLQWIPPNETSALITEKHSTVRDEIAPTEGKRSQKLVEFLEDFEYHKFTVECNLFEEVTEGLQKLIDDNDPRKIDLSLDEQRFAINIVGKKEFTELKAKQIEEFIKDVTEERRLKDSVVSHIESGLSSEQLAVVKISNLKDYLQDSYKYTSLDIDDENGNVIIHCPENKIQEVIAEVLRFLTRVDKEIVSGLSARVLEVFVSKGREFLTNAFKEENLTAVLMMNEEQKSRNEAMVYAVNSDHCRKAVKLIHSFAKEKFIRLQDESMKVVKTRKWEELIDKLKDELVVHIVFDKIHSQTLWISGVKQDVNRCYEDVKEHIDKYTVLQDFVDVSSHGNLKFLFTVWNDKVKKIKEQLKDSFVKIEPNYKQMKIKISGNQEGIKVAKEKLLAYTEKICHEEVIVEKPGMVKFFKSRQGSNHIKIVEREHSCTIEVMEEQEEPTSEAEVSKDLNVICCKTTPEGKILSICKDDLTKHPADVIVNAANEQLKHMGGLAGAIVRAGGQEIQEECDEYIRKNGSLQTGAALATDSGNLPCKRIIHAVGPCWRRTAQHQHAKGQETNEEKLLYSAIQKSLLLAQDYRSIAIPAVSSGIFGFPVDLCARTLIRATIDFFRDHSYCKLSDVRFTNNDDKTVSVFETVMNEVLSDEDEITGSILAHPEESLPRNASNRTEPDKPGLLAATTTPVSNDSTFWTPQGLAISIKVGDISRENSDVLVNTAGRDLNLQNNSCAKSFSVAAGPELQRYCNEAAPVQVGDIRVTPPGKLNCKHVFHAVCGEWKNGSGKKDLCKLLQKCLEEAEKQSARSICIPAIGTGVLGFPRDEVARTSFDEVINFSHNSRPSHVKEVRFVVYHGDQQTIQSFQNELAQRIRSVRVNTADNSARNRISKTKLPGKPLLDATVVSSDFGKKSRDVMTPKLAVKETTPAPAEVKNRKPKLFEIKLDKVTVQVEKGDITHEKTDAIGMFSDPLLEFENQGPTWAAIMSSDGERILLEKWGKHHELPIRHGECVIFSTGNLKVGNLVICSTNSKKTSKYSRHLVTCLKKAEEKEFKSISFPALRTGSLGLSSEDCANFMLSAAKRFSKSRPKSTRLIRIVVFQESMIDDFVAAMKKYSKSAKSLWKIVKSGVTGLTRKLKKRRTKGDVRITEMFLQVYSGSHRSLKNAVTAINAIMTDKCKLQKISQKEAILDIDEAHMDEISVLERKLDCSITVEKENCLITVEGLSEDVLEATTAIHDMLHKIVEAKHERTKAESIAKDVQWEYECDDVFTPYSVEANAKIETAFVNEEEYVIFEENGEEFTINLTTMIEKSTTEGVDAHTNVKRKNLRLGGRVSLPDHWDDQPKSKTGVEVPVHLVDLDPNCPEYIQVSGGFSQSCSQHTITNIRRVQNPEQYRIYSIRKQKMDEESGSNEKQLFHGTAANSCQSINQTGFNRSYCGKNATVLGNGVYFAVNAKYSARQTYSPPDRNGKRYMYLARVLTGEYTKGHQSMIVPPPKNHAQPNDVYDTVVDDTSNPSIFVVFKDGQAYPEYLIEFY